MLSKYEMENSQTVVLRGFFKYGPNPSSFFLILSFSQYNDKYSTINYKWKQRRMLFLEFEPETAALKAQTNPLSYDGPQY